MITLTFCRLFPEALLTRVAGLVLAHSTYTNPVRTTKHAALYTALQKPVLEPLCHLMIWLSPLVWLLNLLSYLNGSAHRSTERSSFSGTETWGQLDFLTRYYLSPSPAVVARGFLAMFRYDATHVLASIPVPTLLFTGHLDRLIVPETARFMAERVPDARLARLEPAGHMAVFERHDRLVSDLAAFADQMLAPRDPPGGEPAPGAAAEYSSRTAAPRLD
jgi:pimeloyl-ACP methyl ester carboxylesterase